jgi:molybdate transport system ATP-binding protein
VSIDLSFGGRVGGFALDLAFQAPPTGVTAVFGPSGSGKTTLLRCIAGLQRLPGRLLVGNEVWQDASRFLAPHRRAVGYVFQEASLFPHLSVRRNLLYGQRRATKSGAAVTVGLDEATTLLGLEALLERGPERLSGGERQRVAIGRALLSGPRLLLMDEPLSSLDAAAKEEILPYLETLAETLALPILYVSHDLAEVERLADTLVLLDKGRLLAAGPLTELQADPALPLVHLPEAAVTLEATASGLDEAYGITSFAVDGGTLQVPGRQGPVGQRRRLRIRASDVSLALQAVAAMSILNRVPARIEAIEPQDPAGVQANVILRLGADGEGARIVARITGKSREALGLEIGSPVFAQIKSVSLVASGAAARADEPV